MRPIKFRAWDGHDMYDNVFATGSREVYDPNGGFWRKVENIMQFTGLFDRHGKEIYEGDVVRCFHEGDNIGNVDEITFKDGAFFLRYRYKPVYAWIEFGGEFEVIGNIHENPNLL